MRCFTKSCNFFILTISDFFFVYNKVLEIESVCLTGLTETGELGSDRFLREAEYGWIEGHHVNWNKARMVHIQLNSRCRIITNLPM
jgi:hypothetical protein